MAARPSSGVVGGAEYKLSGYLTQLKSYVLGGELTVPDTVVAASLLKGYTAHKADGTAIQGTLFSPYNDYCTFTDQLTDQNGVGVTDQNGNAVQGATVYERL